MFTGIIESIATVRSIRRTGDNLDLTFSCPITDELSVAQSLAHNGVCLTITGITSALSPSPEANEQSSGLYTVTAMRETIERTNIGLLREGDLVNIERSMPANGRFDGHIVQGHVDTTAECIGLEDANGSYIYTFRHPFDPAMVKRGYFCADKGSVTVNGVSLTVCNPTDDTFQVNIIPFTFDNTNFQTIRPGTIVNIEFDILGKLVARMQQLG
ncbi:MAG: riboflavin synthase [Bacteroidaceae bacterium]|nr:riboflavin synthase [Bacteroidaceae bacterium]